VSRRCEHSRQISNCRFCKALGTGGASICEHNVRKDQCRKCKGRGFCFHGKRKDRCSICNPLRVYVGIYQRGAKIRSLDFSLSIEHFLALVNNPCVYCGRTPEEVNGMGIDRSDNSIGYVMGNCLPCCELCNTLKSNLDKETFLKHVERIARYSL
jgi:hypothetical protein